MTDEQVTSETATTKPAKNPKRVAAGTLIAEKTRQAREAQKKLLQRPLLRAQALTLPRPPMTVVPTEQLQVLQAD